MKRKEAWDWSEVGGDGRKDGGGRGMADPIPRIYSTAMRSTLEGLHECVCVGWVSNPVRFARSQQDPDSKPRQRPWPS